jgi:sugar phosphate isomerase/epimerase
MPRTFERREFVGATLAAGSALAAGLPLRSLAADASSRAKPRNPICVFIKFMQSMSYDELADTVAAMGVDGIEATVRRGGYIEPPKTPDELPQLVEALAKRNLKVTMITTDVLRADQPNTRPVLQTAAKLGVPMYRMGYYKYDLSKPVMPQLKALGPDLKELAALNRELGIQAVYQNHSGADNVGCAVWDIFSQIKNIPQQDIGLAFDIRHATVEGGLSWPTTYSAVFPRIAAVYVKDFDWVGRKAEHVPLGEGRVDRKFFHKLMADEFTGPISLHVEYLGDGTAQENAAAVTRDLKVLRRWLDS